MFSHTDKNTIITAKSEFERSYRISTLSLAPVLDRMVYAGGVFVSLILNEKPRDVDIFVLNSTKDDVETIKKYSALNANLISIIGKDDVSNSSYLNLRISEVHKIERGGIEYDIIFTDYETAEEVVANFDFLHSKVWYVGGILNVSPKTFKAITNTKLIPTKDDIDPKRKQKFLDRGWKE